MGPSDIRLRKATRFPLWCTFEELVVSRDGLLSDQDNEQNTYRQCLIAQVPRTSLGQVLI